MKAVWVTEFCSSALAGVTEIADPVAGSGEIIVEAGAAEVNYPDMLVMEGRYQIRPPLPFTPGKVAAGRVIELGDGVDRGMFGRRVIAHVEYGAFAERVRAPASTCFPIPDAIGYDIAAALGLAYQTAWFALTERAQLQKGEIVLILGAAGGVGLAALQLARALGAYAVLAAVRGSANAAIARENGADLVIDLDHPDLKNTMKSEVMAFTGGHGADVIVDPVGGEANTAALRAIAWQGRLVTVGFASGEIPKVAAGYLLVKNIAILGLQWSDYRDRTPEKIAVAQKNLFELYERGVILPRITGVFPLAEIGNAFEATRSGRSTGRHILLMGSHQDSLDR